MEEVECAECGHRYDSETQTFCPRCGNEATRRGVTTAALRPDRYDPRRRRVQFAGVILIAMGLVSLAAFVAVAVMAPTFSLADNPSVIDGQPGGDVTLIFTDNGTAVGAPASLTWDGGGVNGTTDANGTFTAEAGSANAVLDVRYNGQTWTREVVSLESIPVTVELDTNDPPTGDPVSAPVPVTSIRVLAGFFAFASVFVVLGGISALRLKGRSIALGGAVAGLLPTLILVTAVPNIASMVLLVILAVALMFILQARSLFR